ncbi:MAG: hypothetical protein KIS66_14865 [Fimbriimonadaceae bacterium]|nr:hypothetical protein [Fimbriimonadaceae bacterium]
MTAVQIAAFVLGVGAGAGYCLWARARRKRARHLTVCEYWVYLPGTAFPDQAAVMARMMRGWGQRGTLAGPIEPSEGLVIGDIRLHVVSVMRSKNRHAFRPDLFERHIVASETVLDALNAAESFVKVRFLAESPLSDRRHLPFVTQMAEAYAFVGGGTVVFDVVTERLFSADEFREDLARTREEEDETFHTRVLWIEEAEASRAETRGLLKIGAPDLRSPDANPDQRVLLTTLLERAVETIWKEGSAPVPLRVEAYGDEFLFEMGESRNNVVPLRVLRKRTT